MINVNVNVNYSTFCRFCFTALILWTIKELGCDAAVKTGKGNCCWRRDLLRWRLRGGGRIEVWEGLVGVYSVYGVYALRCVGNDLAVGRVRCGSRRSDPASERLSKMMSQVQAMKKQVSQLRQEANVQRIPVSQACDE